MSEQQKNNLPDLLVDTREPEELYNDIVKACSDKIVSRETLPSDFIIPPGDKVPGWVIERKKAGDFVGTWFADRLGDQLDILKAFQATHTYRVALMLVGNPVFQRRRGGSKVNPMAVQNMIVSIASQWNIQIIPVYSEWAVPYVLKYLVSKMDGKKSFVNPRSGASREDTPEDQAVYVASGFPGCGPVTLEKIREETSCLAHFVTKSLSSNMTTLTESQTTKINKMLTANWSKSK